MRGYHILLKFFLVKKFLCTEISFTRFCVKNSIIALQLKRFPTEVSVGFILVCNITEDTNILTVTNGSSTSRPKYFFCCSLVPLEITGVCCEGRHSYLYFTCQTNKTLHKLKNMEANIQKIYISTEY